MIVGLVSAKETLKRKFEVEMTEKLEYLPNYNIQPNRTCIFISSDKPGQFSEYHYGMIPSWSKEPVPYYHAPVESHKTEHKEGILRKDIILDQSFRKPIRSQRGILPIDYFIVPAKNNIPYLVFPTEKKNRPVALACIWDCWKKEITDPLTYGFAILTIPAFGVFKEAGIEYLPVVLDEYQYRKWLKPNLSLTAVTEMLVPVPKTELNAFPVSNEIWNCEDNDRRLIANQGELLVKEKAMIKPTIAEKFQRKKFHDSPGFDWGYMKIGK